MRVDLNKKPNKVEKSILDELLGTQDEIERGAPCIPANIELHPTRIIECADGRVFHDVSITIKRADMERVRQGYLCLECLCPCEEAWPVKCSVCGYAVRECQGADFEKAFEGTKWIGSRVDMEQEGDRLEEWADKDRLEKGDRSMGILVPDKAGWAMRLLTGR